MAQTRNALAVVALRHFKRHSNNKSIVFQLTFTVLYKLKITIVSSKYGQ